MDAWQSLSLLLCEYRSGISCSWQEIKRRRELIAKILIQLWQENNCAFMFLIFNDPSNFDEKRVSLFGKYFPGLSEAIFETVKRLKILEQFLQFFKEREFGIILGGGLSYGKFYCVRQDSDIDLIVIVPEDQKLLREILAWFWPEVASIEAGIFLERNVDIFSHKGLTARGIDVSVHFILEETLKKFMPQGSLLNAEDGVFGMEFRNTDFNHPGYSQSNFSGEAILIPKFVSEIKNGFICRFPFWVIRSNRFYPGIFSNLVLPCGEVVKDTETQLALTFVDMFFKFLRQRLTIEKQIVENPESLKLYLAHTRHLIFPNYVLNRT
ncbi:MAG: nucleotidyltransferase domain-containing protein [Patescibacteria group bacterium]